MPSPTDLRSTLGSLLSQTTRLWRKAVDQRLQPFGLTEATWLPLLRLSRAPQALRQKELAASLSLDSSAVVRLLDTLQAAGLIERKEEEADRRAKAILLTPAGQKLVDQVETISAEVREELLSGLSDEEITAAYEVVRHICDRLEARS